MDIGKTPQNEMGRLLKTGGTLSRGADIGKLCPDFILFSADFRQT
jgi:hypothetical protein